MKNYCGKGFNTSTDKGDSRAEKSGQYFFGRFDYLHIVRSQAVFYPDSTGFVFRRFAHSHCLKISKGQISDGAQRSYNFYCISRLNFSLRTFYF